MALAPFHKLSLAPDGAGNLQKAIDGSIKGRKGMKIISAFMFCHRYFFEKMKTLEYLFSSLTINLNLTLSLFRYLFFIYSRYLFSFYFFHIKKVIFLYLLYLVIVFASDHGVFNHTV